LFPNISGTLCRWGEFGQIWQNAKSYQALVFDDEIAASQLGEGANNRCEPVKKGESRT
jgi:hypothetical protein